MAASTAGANFSGVMDAAIDGLIEKGQRELVLTLQELNALGVGFVSLSEPLDLTTPSGRAMAEMLGVPTLTFYEIEQTVPIHLAVLDAMAPGARYERIRVEDAAALERFAREFA